MKSWFLVFVFTSLASFLDSGAFLFCVSFVVCDPCAFDALFASVIGFAPAMFQERSRSVPGVPRSVSRAFAKRSGSVLGAFQALPWRFPGVRPGFPGRRFPGASLALPWRFWLALVSYACPMLPESSPERSGASLALPESSPERFPSWFSSWLPWRSSWRLDNKKGTLPEGKVPKRSPDGRGFWVRSILAS